MFKVECWNEKTGYRQFSDEELERIKIEVDVIRAARIRDELERTELILQERLANMLIGRDSDVTDYEL